jgi:ABC-type sugar transport system permease subunit
VAEAAPPAAGGATRPRPRAAAGPAWTGGGLWAIIFAGPALLLIVVFFLYPFGAVAVHAFTEWDGIEPARFNGLDNFRQLLDDPALKTAIRNNVLFALAVPVQVLLSLVIAVLVYQRTPGWRIFRAVFFVPVIMSPVVIGLIWSAIFALDGPINAALETIGADGQVRDWLGEPQTSIPAIMLVVLWATFGFNMMIYLAGLSALPPGLVDAARVDGATWWKTVRHVILPSLRRVTQLVVVINLITAFAFMVPYIFVMTGGGPGTDTYVTEYLIYNEGFTYGHLGYASAISLALFAVVSVLMLAYVRVLSRTPQ